MANLDALPPELLFIIFSYDAFNADTTRRYNTLFALAATCKALCAAIEEYSCGLLKQHTGITLPEASKRTKSTKDFVCRVKWNKWLTTTCFHCHVKSTRYAILDNTTVCCRRCDKKLYPKMTMTEATSKHYLSKLDLLTPSILHPDLGPLATSTYVCMGSDTRMFSTPDVLARKSHIQSLLGTEASNTVYLKRRIAAHDRIIRHKDITVCKGKWVRAGFYDSIAEEDLKAKSMRTSETREKYVKDRLEKEWTAMGMTMKYEELNFDAIIKGHGPIIANIHLATMSSFDGPIAGALSRPAHKD